jgi:polar amino acid transport system substrate-binding protein
MRPIAMTIALLAASATVAAATPAKQRPPTRTQGVLTVAVELGNPGFAEGTLARPTGFDVDVARALARRLGLRPRFVRYPFGRLFLPGPKPYDVALQFVTVLDSRKRLVDFSIPYYSSRQGALVSRGTRTPTSLAELRKLQVCGKEVTTGLAFIQNELRPASLVLEYATARDALRALSTGICDGFVFDLPALIAAKRADPSRYGDLAGQFGPTERYGVVLPKGSKLTPAVNAAVRSLIGSGTTTRLARSYFGSSASVPVLR